MPKEAVAERHIRDLRRIDLNLLLVFEAIFKAESVSQAAQTLGMAQPTVSNALNDDRGSFTLDTANLPPAPP